MQGNRIRPQESLTSQWFLSTAHKDCKWWQSHRSQKNISSKLRIISIALEGSSIFMHEPKVKHSIPRTLYLREFFTVLETELKMVLLLLHHVRMLLYVYLRVNLMSVSLAKQLA